MRRVWTVLKFIGRWFGPVLIMFALWMLFFTEGPWGNMAGLPAQFGGIISAIALLAGWKSGWTRGRQVLATCALFGLAFGGWSSWANRQGFTEQAISFHNQGAHLVGTIYLPEAKPSGPSAKVPGIVFLSGSGAIPASNFGGIATYFTRRGFAVLIYDKRGVGKSTGIREARSFTDVHRDLEALASDAAAGLSFLQSRPEVGGKPTGFVGISEGGLIAPRAAALNGHAAFMLNITTTTGSLFELGEFQGWPRSEARAWFGKDFVPMESLRMLDIPGLWLSADGDTLVDNRATQRDVDELRKLGKPYEYRLIPHAWHGLFFAPAKLSQDAMDSWLARVTTQKPDGK